MLETLRKSTGSVVVKILFAILILSFGLWGVGDMVRGGAGVQPAISVGDVEIGAPYVRQQFQTQLDELRQTFGPNLTADMARQMGLLEDTIARVVSAATLDMATRDLGIVVTKEAMASTAMAEPAFQVNGTFNRDQFLRFLAANNLTEDRYFALVADDLRRARLVEPLVLTGAAPDTLAQALYRYRNEGRVAETLVVDAAALPLDAQPADDELQAIYESSMDRYTAPQYRKLTTVKLATEDVLKRAEVDDTAIADHYEANQDLYGQPASRTLTQVLAADQATAEAVAKAAQGGATLADAALAAGAPAPLEMGAITRESLPEEMAGPVFALDAGQTSAPVQTPLGWHVFHVEAATPARRKPLDEVREEIRERIAAEQAVTLLYEESANLQDALGGGATLEEAAERLNLRLYKVEAVDVDGRTPQGQPAELPEAIRGEILQTAFGLEEGQESLMQETDSGYYVVRVDDVIPAAPRPFAEVREQVVAQWRETARQKKAEELAQTLAADAAPPATLQALASRSPAVSYVRRPLITRQGETVGDAAAALPRELVGRLFDMKVGDVAAVPMAEGAVVLRLAEVTPADPAANADRVKALGQRLRADVADDLLVQMSTAFTTRYGVEVNRPVIDAAF
ncbi:peptidyl-prolyl cis-trans isomerase [Novispirillum sp. DQ9]|uniref:peptidyl-prolyl cis-trans isomerase n=1 Tax=Novispirillum sp. DQ9 TaxID=3398612 RepID=UPI003C7A16BE